MLNLFPCQNANFPRSSTSCFLSWCGSLTPHSSLLPRKLGILRMKPCFSLWFEWTAFCLSSWGMSIVYTAFRMSIQCLWAAQVVACPGREPPCLALALGALIALWPKTPHGHLSSLKQADPGCSGFLWRSSFSSYLSCWHMAKSEHLGSSDTEGPFLAFPTQAQMHKLVHRAETPRDCTIRFVE